MEPTTRPDILPKRHYVGSPVGFLRFALQFWSARSARRAWYLATAILLLLLANLVVNIGLNRWHRWFFDALERRDATLLPLAIASLAGLIVTGAAFAVAMVKCRMTLQVSWRQWVTESLINSWFGRGVFGPPKFPNENHGSPAFRLAEDLRLALDPITELTIGFINAIISAATFVGVLVIVGGSLSVSIAGWHLAIPAYIALAALIYAALVSSTTYIIGQPLVRRVGQKNEAEAQFLFELTRAAEGPAFGGTRTSPPNDLDAVSSAFRRTIKRWHRVIREHCRLTWITNSSSFFSPMLPLLLAAPKYINGELSLGAVMQVAAAFTMVLGALNWFSDNYIRLAEWSASAKRVDELRHELDGVQNPGDRGPAIAGSQHPDD